MDAANLKVGDLSPSARFWRRFPDRERRCEARGCGETRIVEIAHRTPLRGAAMSIENSKADDVWILCPTCHRLLDSGRATPDDLGLDPFQAGLTADDERVG